MFYKASGPHEDYDCDCPTCGGSVKRARYWEVMKAGSFLDTEGRRIEIERVPAAGFADPIYLDPLTQYFDGGLYRLWPSERYLTRGGKRLHRRVWEAAFGPIPEGCHIHHRDSDPLNNRLPNLECLPAADHLSLTWEATKETRGQGVSAHAREKAAEWHRSEEGRLWHRRHAERSKSWTKWKREPRACECCGTEFSALVRKSGHSQRFCSTNCKATAFRRKRSAQA